MCAIKGVIVVTKSEDGIYLQPYQIQLGTRLLMQSFEAFASSVEEASVQISRLFAELNCLGMQAGDVDIRVQYEHEREILRALQTGLNNLRVEDVWTHHNDNPLRAFIHAKQRQYWRTKAARRSWKHRDGKRAKRSKHDKGQKRKALRKSSRSCHRK